MCLYPRFIKNRKYIPNKKNNGNPPISKDWRVLYVPIGCGQCIECRKQKAQQWKVRLNEEIKTNKKPCYFITLSFSPEALKKIGEKLKTPLQKITNLQCNAVAGKGIRLFLERYRKKYKKSMKHWLITELGEKNTERIHIHGLIWTENINEIENLWNYGNIYIGNYVNNKTINYIIKYVTKIDEIHKGYLPQIFCSAGIGKTYLETWNAKQNKYKPLQTKEYYLLPNGNKVNLPIYYRNKIYTEEEREKLWLEKIDKHEIYILGTKYEIKNKKDENKINEILKNAQEKNVRIGYGDNSKKWKKKDYNITLRMLNQYNHTTN